MLRQPYQRTTAQALGKKGLKDGLSNTETISIGGGKVYVPLKSMYEFYLKEVILMSIQHKIKKFSFVDSS